MPVIRTDAVAVGAGFCGLGLGASLRRAGVTDFAILEQGRDVGGFWAGNYDRIRLHSPWHPLPHDGGLLARYPLFKPRDQVLDYFRRYAEGHGLYEQLRFGRRVQAVERVDGEWEVSTDEERYRAPFLAVATAMNRVPSVPEIPGQQDFGGDLLHSRAYKNGRPYAGKRVLVVGSGNSAAEIALDLTEHGAASVHMWVRAPRHFIPIVWMARFARIFRVLGLAFTEKAILRGHAVTFGDPAFQLELERRDRLIGRVSVDLSEYGIVKPELGPMVEMYSKLRVPVFDQGTIPAIRAGRVGVIDGNQCPIEALTPNGVRFPDDEQRFDTVILATGVRHGLEEFLADSDRLLERHPDLGLVVPRLDGRCRSSVEPSLFFPGFSLTLNGGISMGLWGWEAGEQIATALRGKVADPPQPARSPAEKGPAGAVPSGQ